MASYVRANGLRFAVLTDGPPDGPLALCMHGFPDTASTFRGLLSALGDAGYRAVAPWMRGYAPTEVPEDRRTSIATLAADANALHRALGGDERAVLIGHDWGAVAAYRAAAAAPGSWRRVVTLAVPPEPALRGANRDPAQLRRSWYIAAFQAPGAARVVAADDLALIDRLYAQWSPGWQAPASHLREVKAALRSPGSLESALSYYRGLRRSLVTGTPDRGATLPTVPTLYLHGERDGCIGIEYASHVRVLLPAGSSVEAVAAAGHFLHLERPEPVARRVLDFLGAAGEALGSSDGRR